MGQSWSSSWCSVLMLAVLLLAAQMVARLGREIGDPSSICYWAARNGVPVFCPALTDGSLGDMLFFHTYKNPGLVLDIVADIRAINDEALKAAPRKTGMIILGGGAQRCQAAAWTFALSLADPLMHLLLAPRLASAWVKLHERSMGEARCS